MNDIQILDELERLVMGRVKTSDYNLIDWIGTTLEDEYTSESRKWHTVWSWLRKERAVRAVNNLGRSNDRSKG